MTTFLKKHWKRCALAIGCCLLIGLALALFVFLRQRDRASSNVQVTMTWPDGKRWESLFYPAEDSPEAFGQALQQAIGSGATPGLTIDIQARKEAFRYHITYRVLRKEDGLVLEAEDSDKFQAYVSRKRSRYNRIEITNPRHRPHTAELLKQFGMWCANDVAHHLRAWWDFAITGHDSTQTSVSHGLPVQSEIQ